MGYNTSVIIRNDALEYIEKDPEFGRKISKAVGDLSLAAFYAEKNNREFQGVDVCVGASGNAATVIETHHADAISVVAFGGNRGVVLSASMYPYGTEDENVRILKELAYQYGYDLRKKS